jgi:hypothetical protein
VNHHGFNLSNSKAFVDAIHPRVAIMDNGAHKAGSPRPGRRCMRAPASKTCGCCTPPKTPTPPTTARRPLIANVKGGADGAYLKVVAHKAQCCCVMQRLKTLRRRRGLHSRRTTRRRWTLDIMSFMYFGTADGTPVEYDSTGPAFEFNWGAIPNIQLHAILPFGAAAPTNNPVYAPNGTGRAPLA